MPTPTFHNLPAEKRDRIVGLAIEEFSERPYARASLSRIVARAGIAKGSIYQYFDNKLDLYRWLLTDEMGRRKMAAIADSAPPAGSAIWDVLEAAFVAGFTFALAEPRLTRLGARFLRDADEPGLREIAIANRAASDLWLLGLLREAQERGELRPGLDLALASAFLSMALGEGMLQVLAKRVGVDLIEFARDPSLASSLSPDDLHELVQQVLAFLREGIGQLPQASP